MTTLRTAAKQALEALQNCANGEDDVLLTRDALAALRAALAEEALQRFTDVNQEIEAAMQEPVAWANQADLISARITHDRGGQGDTHTWSEARSSFHGLPLYTAPPQQAEKMEPMAWRFEARHMDTAWCSAVSLKHPGPEGVYMRNVVPLYTAPPQRPAEPVQEPPCATRECMPSECPNCVSLQDQNTELDRKLEELERKPMNEFDALRLVTKSIGHLQSAGPVEGLIGIIRAVERAHGITL